MKLITADKVMQAILAYNLTIFLFLHAASCELLASDKKEICDHLECDQEGKKRVCGIRMEGDKTIFKIFDNQCELLQYGCQVDNEKAYGIINMEYCEKTTPNYFSDTNTKKNCVKCPNDIDPQPICGIMVHGDGYKIRLFDSDCLLVKHNCEMNLNFRPTESFICNGMKMDNEKKNENNDTIHQRIKNAVKYDETKNDDHLKMDGNEQIDDNMQINDDVKLENIVVVRSMIDRNNINESIDNFFAATHVFDLPLQEMQPHLNESVRRMLMKVAGPVMVFKPLAEIPKNITDDEDHNPTLSSCYHKCPKKCPETYAPVCATPGTGVREPALNFKNHCYMDQAQCKMRRENKSPTALSAAYIEASFLFCMGDPMNALYRFLPFIRTLQHMGRLKLKGHFRYKLKNMRFFNNLISIEPKFMG